MAKRKRINDYVQQAHLKFLNETTGASSFMKTRIPTTNYIKPVNVHQKQFVKSIKRNQITIANGCAGTGKTLLALFTAVQLINNPDNSLEKITYVRANVDDREEKDIGALPGDVLEKVRHLAHPVIDNLELFMKSTDIEYLISEEKIEVLPLMMMRGRSFNNKVLIIDECQNITPKSLKTIMTRFCESSKIILIGDPDQCDIELFKNGLSDLVRRVKMKLQFCEENNEDPGVDIDIITFNRDDIIRSHATKFALELYDL